MSLLKEAKREEYKKNIDLLLKQYREAFKAHRLETNPVTKVTLQANLDEIEQQLQEAETALDALEKEEDGAQTGLNLLRQDQKLREKLSQLDFRQAREICGNTILHRQRRRQQPVALIMLHDIDEMEGDLYIDDLKQMLQKDATEFRQFPVEFGLRTEFSDEALLVSLTDYFPVSADPDLPTFTKALVNKICAALGPNSTFLFEFRLIDDPFLHEQFPKWLMEHFWHPLVEQFRVVHEQNPRAKLIALIVVTPALTADKLKSAYFCSDDQFAAEQILRLPLSTWTQDDIFVWIDNLLYGELPDEDIKAMA
ncbi:MAG: hypothetical protein KC421_17125, partial [Anaerolineales bacterium]|nr:hypothetical protein [Anaerolineales bacterium]